VLAVEWKDFFSKVICRRYCLCTSDY